MSQKPFDFTTWQDRSPTAKPPLALWPPPSLPTIAPSHGPPWPPPTGSMAHAAVTSKAAPLRPKVFGRRRRLAAELAAAKEELSSLLPCHCGIIAVFNTKGGSGKSTTLAELGRIIAQQSNITPILCDTSQHGGSLHQVVGVGRSQTWQLREIMAAISQGRFSSKLFYDLGRAVDGRWVVASDSPNWRTLRFDLPLAAFANTFARLGEISPYLLLDTSCVWGAANTAVLAATDGLVITARAGDAASLAAAAETAEYLANGHLGVVFDRHGAPSYLVNKVAELVSRAAVIIIDGNPDDLDHYRQVVGLTHGSYCCLPAQSDSGRSPHKTSIAWLQATSSIVRQLPNVTAFPPPRRKD